MVAGGRETEKGEGMSTYRDWHVGMKVVCVGGTPPSPAMNEYAKRNRLSRPCLNKVYTIREITVIVFEGAPHPAVRLQELDNSHVVIREHGGEPAFLARRFRPVQKRKTDISQFTAMLNSQPVVKGARERA